MVRSGAQNRKGPWGTTAVAQSPKSPTARVRLGDVCKINYGERVRKVDSSGDAFPVYGGGGETFRWAFANRVDKCVISRFAMSRECVRFVKGRFFLNDSGLTVESVDKSLNQDFLDWFLIGSQEKIYACGQGAAQRNLDIRRFRDLLVPIPTKEEQSCVVFKLDKISRLITLRKRQLSKLDELVKSRFVEMFGDVVANDRGWRFVPLGKVCDVRDGTHASPKYCTHGYPLMTSKNFTDGYEDFSDVKLISKKDFDEINKRSHVDLGDIVMPMIGTIGNPVIIKTDKEFAIKNVSLIKFTNASPINVFVKAVCHRSIFREWLKKGTEVIPRSLLRWVI